ncbi:T9SS type A sorting domain-containing protein [Emticicia sp. CRIBPO]|uniref:T9SS type A sorting domain-containing protein n=1 Tax=Emticicia sp. CRIBPO TaxID=2683258 RepID=UPI001412F94F|nr:T9SS type A sorting domain-containing protein [Emticicia sp. CRIBPO]NBA87960.1 T9SS type A sorting domain-containing protein [Emticicia sp. CRIBPO]
MTSALKKIAIALMLLTSVGGYTYAQNSTAKSRLDIGKTPKKTNLNTTPVNSLIIKPNSKEIKLNKSQAVNQFYRDLLMNQNNAAASDKSNPAVNLVAETSSDKFFKNEKLVVNNIYPNPANDQAFVDYKVSGKFKTANITFYNLLGVQVADYELDKNDERLRLQTASWDPGIYMYQLIIDGKKIATKKLLVRRN